MNRPSFFLERFRSCLNFNTYEVLAGLEELPVSQQSHYGTFGKAVVRDA